MPTDGEIPHLATLAGDKSAEHIKCAQHSNNQGMKLKSLKPKYISLIIIGIGVVFLFAHEIRTGIAYLQAGLIKVDHPIALHQPAYQVLLKKFVKGDLVDYASMCKTKELQAAVDELKCTSPDRLVNEKDQLAYWIDALNLMVMEGVCERYPINSIRQLGNSPSSKQYIVGGKPFTIQDLYTDQVLPLAKKVEPLSIFLVCQGAIGYPPVVDHTLDSENLEIESKTAVYKFVNNPKNAYFDWSSKTFKISPFFQWTNDLFSDRYETPHAFVNFYREEKVDMASVTVMKTFTLPFDWRLNDTRFAKQDASN